MPDSPLYNMAWRFDIFLDLDPAVFSRAFRDVVEGSDSMRAVFWVREGQAMQRDSGELPADAEVVDLSASPDPSAAADAWINRKVGISFDLSICSYRYALLKLDKGHWVWHFNQHHIACDAHATSVLFREVSDRYEALLQGKSCTAAAETPSFFDYASELAEALDSPTLAGTREFFAGKREQHAASSVPYQYLQAQRTPGSRRVVLKSEAELWRRLDAAAERDGFAMLTADPTRFTLLLTAFAGYLMRATGDTQVSIGVPVHNRLTARDRETIGLMVDVLPLSIEIAPQANWSALRAKVADAVSQLLRHARPGASSADAARRCDFALNFVRAEFGRFAGAEARIDWRHSDAHDPRQAIRLHITDFSGTGAPTLSLDLNEAVFDAALRARAPLHFAAALSASLDTPGEPISAAPLASPEELAEISSHLERPEETDTATSTVLDAFLRTASAMPDLEAVSIRDTHLSYGDIDELSDRFAARLQAAGLDHGDAAILIGQRSVEIVVAFLGILKAGGCAIPTSAATPAARLADIVRQSGARLCVSDDDGAKKAQPHDVRIARLDIDEQPAHETIKFKPGPADAAYMIFTSGSTGVPKGVAVAHRDLLRYATWAAREFSHGAARYPLFSSLSFDLTITSIFAPLVSGGCIRVYPETGDTDLAVLDVFAEDAVDVLKLTPAHLALACASGYRVERIRTLVLGGENLTTALCKRAMECLSQDLEIINEYGPTEAVVGCMIHRYDPADDDGPSVPIGSPADGVHISVRDTAHRLVPFGVVGELCIGGRLAIGYHGRPDLTEQRFVPDPLAPGETIYCSGDLGRLLPPGTFEYSDGLTGRSSLVGHGSSSPRSRLRQ